MLLLDREPASGAKRSALVGSALKILLLLTFVAAYLNPILRASEESTLTVFRAMLPIVATVFFVRFIRLGVTRRYLFFIAIVLFYSIAQMFVFGFLSDGFVWSYLSNIVAAIVFIYFVYLYRTLYGTESLFRHLYLWYAVLVTASVHQLLTDFEYPNAPFREGVARIFFGQENDTSLALAAFLPVLLSRVRRDPLAAVLAIAGVVIVYLNNTRGVLVAIAAYPVMLAVSWAIGRLSQRAAILKPIVAAIVVLGVLSGVYFLQDSAIRFTDYETTLSELVVDPVTEIVTGQMMDAELTSINLRVTLALVGLLQYASTFGFGVGPGASTYFVQQYYEGVATSMHIFPLQLLTECGWLFLATVIWIAFVWGPRLGWKRFLPVFIYLNLAACSITAGGITNYYFFACAVFILTTVPKVPGRRVIRSRTLTAPETR